MSKLAIAVTIVAITTLWWTGALTSPNPSFLFWKMDMVIATPLGSGFNDTCKHVAQYLI